MKYRFLAILLFPIITFGQKLEENKVDEFTKSFVKRTSWETISPFNMSNRFYAFTSFRKINNIYLLDFKMTLRNDAVFSINKGDNIMFKTSDSVIIMSNSNYKISCKGCGVKGFTGSGLEGIEVVYEISESDVKYLISNKIKKIRVYTSDGYVEEDIKEKYAEMFIRQLKLVY